MDKMETKFFKAIGKMEQNRTKWKTSIKSFNLKLLQFKIFSKTNEN